MAPTTLESIQLRIFRFRQFITLQEAHVVQCTAAYNGGTPGAYGFLLKAEINLRDARAELRSMECQAVKMAESKLLHSVRGCLC
jgi:hypothetical protein